MSGPQTLFTTERLSVRHLTPADEAAMLAVYGDADAMRWVDDGRPIEPQECRRWIEVTLANYERRGYGMSALVLRRTGAVVGFLGVVHPGGQEEAELKYALLREHWGRGLATEAAAAMLAHVRRVHGIASVVATAAPENGASHRVLEKVGMCVRETRRDADGSEVLVFAWKAPD